MPLEEHATAALPPTDSEASAEPNVSVDSDVELAANDEFEQEFASEFDDEFAGEFGVAPSTHNTVSALLFPLPFRPFPRTLPDTKSNDVCCPCCFCYHYRAQQQQQPVHHGNHPASAVQGDAGAGADASDDAASDFDAEFDAEFGDDPAAPALAPTLDADLDDEL